MQESHEFLADLWNQTAILLPPGIDLSQIELAGGLGIITFVDSAPPQFVAPDILAPYFLGGCI